MIAINQ